MKWYTVGSASISASWIAILIAVLLTSVFLYFRKNKFVSDLFGNAVFIWFFIWKFSVVLFQFKLSLSNPLSILYFSGGIKGYWLGMAIAFAYAYFKLRKHPHEKSSFVAAWVCAIISYEAASAFLIQESYVWTIIQLAIGALFLFFYLQQGNKKYWSEQLFVLFTGIQAIQFSLRGELFTTEMGTYILMVIIFSFLRNYKIGKA